MSELRNTPIKRLSFLTSKGEYVVFDETNIKHKRDSEEIKQQLLSFYVETK